MDNSTVQAFLTVAETGSFRKAATKLGYTQAGISYIIKTLENDMGLTLFIRERSGVTLSPEGAQLLPQIKKMDADNRALEQAINEIKGLDQGTLRVQIFDSMSIHWLPGILEKFKSDFPGINIELETVEDNAVAAEMVMSGEVDCGFFSTMVQWPINSFVLKEEKLLAVMSPDHPLAGADKFPTSRLGEFPYIEMAHEDHQGITDIFDKYDAEKNIAYSMDNDYAAMAMASKGLGYCIFPELLIVDAPYEIKCLEFDEPETRIVSIGTRSMKSASKACLKFIEYTRRWVEENA